ncbi:MAG TPA: alpha/beta hydrolase [Candidatus Acidoferrum sp.]|nr:alpha/beta hydrolase [Candidatus Acidoferrum sp.]
MLAFFAWVFIIGTAAILAGYLFQVLGKRRDAKHFPPPGRLIDVGTHRLHLLEQGRTGPTVVLEAGLMSTVLSWSELQRRLARRYRVVSYDRAGLGWSDAGPLPRTADRIVTELHRLLQRAGVAPPYILVGHSFGGLTMPLFAARFPEETAGMVLVDPVAPAEWNPPSEHDRKLSRVGAAICRRAAVLSRFGLIRLVSLLLSTRLKKVAAHLVRFISRGAPADSGSVASTWFSALPKKEREMAAVFWVQEQFAEAIASQLESLPASAARIMGLKHVCEQPAVILSAKSAPEKRRREHAAMAARLPLGQFVAAERSGHWIMQDEPDLVMRAIKSVAELSATGAFLASGGDAA